MTKKKKKGSARKDSNEKEQFIYEGTIVEPIKDIMFHIRLHHHSKIFLDILFKNMDYNPLVLRKQSQFKKKKGKEAYYAYAQRISKETIGR